MEMLSAKRTVTVEGNKNDEEETCFSCSLAPSELYMELIHSYCATCVVDASPAQGEFLKAALSTRTKAVAICGTESHCARLELLLTEFILAELCREGSTFYRPDSVSKDGDEEEKKADEPKKKADSKKKPKRAAEDETQVAKKKARKPKAAAEEEEQDETEAEEPKKKSKKTKKKKEEPEAEEGDGESSDLWG